MSAPSCLSKTCLAVWEPLFQIWLHALQYKDWDNFVGMWKKSYCPIYFEQGCMKIKKKKNEKRIVFFFFQIDPKLLDLGWIVYIRHWELQIKKKLSSSLNLKVNLYILYECHLFFFIKCLLSNWQKASNGCEQQNINLISL